ncbi:MAG: two pore domain potassium channel family protein [Deltaproteobacteria bacterium]|nr:two pore domain potassium channel family protein [Deltaproteobacteria bacterium]
MKRHLRRSWNFFWRQLAKAFRNPIFLALTIVGNTALVVCACLLYFVEYGVNPQISGFGDCLWWAFVTITTVGYGDVTPITLFGRIIAVLLMMTGGVLFFSFLGLLSSSFVEREFHQLEHEIRDLRASVDRLVNERDASRRKDPDDSRV